jgi:hypothetical protein
MCNVDSTVSEGVTGTVDYILLTGTILCVLIIPFVTVQWQPTALASETKFSTRIVSRVFGLPSIHVSELHRSKFPHLDLNIMIQANLHITVNGTNELLIAKREVLVNVCAAS